MAIVAMSREMGSLGKDVAQRLAEALGVEVAHHEVIDHLADRMRMRKSHVVSYLEGRQGFLERLTANDAAMHIHTADEILGLAEARGGIVLRGWGATALLRGVQHAIRVRVCAPREVRAERMMERLETGDRGRVLGEIAKSDEAYGAIMRRLFDVDAFDANHYDLVLNTERIAVDECVDEILHHLRSARFAETDAARATLRDRALAARVRGALRLDERTRDCRIAVDANDGHVVLAGIVDTREEIEACQVVAAGAPGVRSVSAVLNSQDRGGARRPG